MAATSSFAIDVPASLLARVRAGDLAAFEHLYRRFERPVFTLALRMSAVAARRTRSCRRRC